MTPWPYPRWVAHRGAGKLAPENTLAAFRVGASHGFRMFECDVKLSADGVPFLMHDATLQRTTNARAQLGAGRTFVLAACGGNHRGTKSLGQLNRRHADTTGAALNQQGFTGFELTAVKHIAPHRE